MFAWILEFADQVLAALLVGALFGVWLFLDPAGLDAKSYITVQQQAIRTMNRVMPLLGGVTILMTIAAAVSGRDDRRQFWLLVAAALCFFIIGLVTRFLNQPINAIVITWRPESPPPNWMMLRDQWWRWHLLRLAVGLAGLSLMVTARLSRC